MSANAHFFPGPTLHIQKEIEVLLFCFVWVFFLQLCELCRRDLVMPDEAGTRLSRGPRVGITSWRASTRTALARFSAGEMFGLPTRREFVHVLMTDKQRRQPMQIRRWYQSWTPSVCLAELHICTARRTNYSSSSLSLSLSCAHVCFCVSALVCAEGLSVHL